MMPTETTYGYDLTKETYSQRMIRAKKEEWLNTYKENQMQKLDAQGRHRSEWCYAAYDGRITTTKDDAA